MPKDHRVVTNHALLSLLDLNLLISLDALITEPSGRGGSVCVHDAIGDLVEDMMPIALSIGEGDALRGVERILTEGNATDRVRAYHAQHCDWRMLVEWLQEETLRGTGVQRVPA